MPVTPHKINGELAKLQFTPAGGAATILAALTDWEVNIKVTSADATTNDSVGWEEKKDSMKSWTATAKTLYVEGDASQNAIVDMIINSNYAAGYPQFTFYPEQINPAGSGENSFVGHGFFTDWKITAKNKSLIACDLTIEGTGALTRTAQ